MKSASVASLLFLASLGFTSSCQKNDPVPNNDPAPKTDPVAKSDAAAASDSPSKQGLWDVYNERLKQAKYIDLTHAFSPTIPVWPGFGPAKFKPSVAGHAIPDFVKKGDEFTYKKHGFAASAYELTTDQYGTQLDPPA